MRRVSHLAIMLFASVALVAPAQAATVTFTGVVANLCVLTLTTSGTLGISGSGSVMSTDEAGGLPAAMTVAATGTAPTIAFGAPQLLGPAPSTAASTKEIEYTSVGGASQGLTSGATNYVMNRLLDTMTIKGRVTNPAGFVSGTYVLSSTATCQQ